METKYIAVGVVREEIFVYVSYCGVTKNIAISDDLFIYSKGDSCPKGFCEACIQRNFGAAELHRILQLEDRWTCYVCTPQVSL